MPHEEKTSERELKMRIVGDDLRRFLSKVIIYDNTECIEWKGGIQQSKQKYGGYGTFWYSGRKGYAHRFIYEHCEGKIPNGLVIDHLCRNRICVNPSHLRITTTKDNILCGEGFSANQARKKECTNGHPFSGENLYIRKDNGGRQCKLCKRENLKNYQARKQFGTL